MKANIRTLQKNNKCSQFTQRISTHSFIANHQSRIYRSQKPALTLAQMTSKGFVKKYFLIPVCLMAQLTPMHPAYVQRKALYS